MKLDRKIVYSTIMIGVALWAIDAVTDSMYFSESRFYDALFSVPTHEIYGRLTTFVIILVAGFLLAKTMAKQKAAEGELAKVNSNLEMKVQIRTDKLRQTNEQLEVELNERRKMEEALEESGKRLRNVSLQLLTIQEVKSREIARELHDEFGQTLAVLKQRLWRIQKRVKAEESEIEDDVNESLQTVDQIIENVRRISRNLSPHILEYGGLSTALQKLVNDFSKNYSIHVTPELSNLDHKIPRESHIIVYRIFQEALNNIGKHACASRMTISMRSESNNASFLIEDNGRGFDVNHTILRNASGKGLGLAILDERVKMLGGELAIWSQEGKGTRVSFRIPLSTTYD